MNRIELVGLFTAIERMCEKNDLEGIRILTERVLNEAMSANENTKPRPRKLPLDSENL